VSLLLLPFYFLLNSPALRWRHDGNLVARFQFVIAIDKFNACANQNALVMATKRRLFRIDLVEQVAHSGPFREIDIQLTDSNQIA
jgi:hypothetical protein